MQYQEKLQEIVRAANDAAQKAGSPIRFGETDFTTVEVERYWRLVGETKQAREAANAADCPEMYETSGAYEKYLELEQAARLAEVMPENMLMEKRLRKSLTN